MTNEEYKNLNEQMKEYARSHNAGQPIIEDPQWDSLIAIIKEYELNNPDDVLEDSVTQKVGMGVFGEAGTVMHVPPMLSLNNAMDIPAAIKLLESPSFTITKLHVYEYKADGVACRLVYKDGKFTQALTRGDGIYGEDITHHITPNEVGFPLTVEHEEDLMVDGELVIKYADFDVLNRNRTDGGKDAYKNTRNAVAGMLQSNELTPLERSSISFIAYEMHSSLHSLSWTMNREWLKEQDFDVVPRLKGRDFKEVAEDLAKKRDSLDFMIDGIVVKLDEYSLRKKLSENNTAPRWAFSYKFPALTRSTILKDVVFNVGRTGQITAVALFEPVDIGGVVVSRSVIDSVDRWRELGPALGSVLTVSRRADVRPYIESCDPCGKPPMSFISICLSCNTKLTQRGMKVFCTNNLCKERVTSYLEYVVSKSVLDIDGLSLKTIQSFKSFNRCQFISDIYKLTVDELVKKGFGKRSAENIVSALKDSKTTTVDRVISAFGIPLIGGSTSKDIANYLRDIGVKKINDIVDHLLIVENIDNLPIGDAAKQSFKEYIEDEYYKLRIESFKEVGFESKIIFGALSRTKFCITGSLTSITRKDLERKLLKAGATIVSNVAQDTTALIMDDSGESSSAKYQKAKAIGTRIITSEQAINEFLS